MITEPIVRIRRAYNLQAKTSRRRSTSNVNSISKEKIERKSNNRQFSQRSISFEPEIHEGPFGYYHEDSENSLSESSKPVGFLDFIDCSESGIESESDVLIYQFYLLKSLFPDFPEKLLRTLFIREQCNSKNIAKELIDKGWKPSNVDLIPKLNNNSSDYVDIPYYWGGFKEEYLEKLKRSPVGSYFTIWDSNSFILFALNFRKEVLRIPIESPNVYRHQKLLFSLVEPINRKRSVSIFHLYPFVGL